MTDATRRNTCRENRAMLPLARSRSATLSTPPLIGSELVAGAPPAAGSLTLLYRRSRRESASRSQVPERDSQVISKALEKRAHSASRVLTDEGSSARHDLCKCPAIQDGD